LSWAPGPIANSRFTPEEMTQITVGATPAGLQKALDKVAPGWKISDCGPDMDPGLRAEFGGRKNVFVSHPLDKDTGCKLSKKIDVPAGKQTALRLVVGHAPNGDFDLIVRADGKQLLKQTVGKATAKNGWLETSVDLSPWAGKVAQLELVNQPNGWSWEAAYWAEIAVESK